MGSKMAGSQHADDLAKALGQLSRFDPCIERLENLGTMALPLTSGARLTGPRAGSGPSLNSQLEALMSRLRTLELPRPTFSRGGSVRLARMGALATSLSAVNAKLKINLLQPGAIQSLGARLPKLPQRGGSSLPLGSLAAGDLQRLNRLAAAIDSVQRGLGLRLLDAGGVARLQDSLRRHQSAGSFKISPPRLADLRRLTQLDQMAKLSQANSSLRALSMATPGARFSLPQFQKQLGPGGSLDSLARALAPGGRLASSLPSAKTIASMLGQRACLKTCRSKLGFDLLQAHSVEKIRGLSSTLGRGGLCQAASSVSVGPGQLGAASLLSSSMGSLQKLDLPKLRAPARSGNKDLDELAKADFEVPAPVLRAAASLASLAEVASPV